MGPLRNVSMNGCDEVLQRQRRNSNNEKICCSTVICNKNQGFSLCTSDGGNDTCTTCPHDKTTGMTIDTLTVEMQFDACIQPKCHDNGNSTNCRTNTRNVQSENAVSSSSSNLVAVYVIIPTVAISLLITVLFFCYKKFSEKRNPRAEYQKQLDNLRALPSDSVRYSSSKENRSSSLKYSYAYARTPIIENNEDVTGMIIQVNELQKAVPLVPRLHPNSQWDDDQSHEYQTPTNGQDLSHSNLSIPGSQSHDYQLPLPVQYISNTNQSFPESQSNEYQFPTPRQNLSNSNQSFPGSRNDECQFPTHGQDMSNSNRSLPGQLLPSGNVLTIGVNELTDENNYLVPIDYFQDSPQQATFQGCNNYLDAASCRMSTPYTLPEELEETHQLKPVLFENEDVRTGGSMDRRNRISTETYGSYRNLSFYYDLFDTTGPDDHVSSVEEEELYNRVFHEPIYRNCSEQGVKSRLAVEEDSIDTTSLENHSSSVEEGQGSETNVHDENIPGNNNEQDSIDTTSLENHSSSVEEGQGSETNVHDENIPGNNNEQVPTRAVINDIFGTITNLQQLITQKDNRLKSQENENLGLQRKIQEMGEVIKEKDAKLGQIYRLLKSMEENFPVDRNSVEMVVTTSETINDGEHCDGAGLGASVYYNR